MFATIRLTDWRALLNYTTTSYVDIEDFDSDVRWRDRALTAIPRFFWVKRVQIHYELIITTGH